jgi:hypothetical protein
MNIKEIWSPGIKETGENSIGNKVGENQCQPAMQFILSAEIKRTLVRSKL